MAQPNLQQPRVQSRSVGYRLCAATTPDAITQAPGAVECKPAGDAEDAAAAASDGLP
jgi:hypothetical protein